MESATLFTGLETLDVTWTRNYADCVIYAVHSLNTDTPRRTGSL